LVLLDLVGLGAQGVDAILMLLLFTAQSSLFFTLVVVIRLVRLLRVMTFWIKVSEFHKLRARAYLLLQEEALRNYDPNAYQDYYVEEEDDGDYPPEEYVYEEEDYKNINIDRDVKPKKPTVVETKKAESSDDEEKKASSKVMAEPPPELTSGKKSKPPPPPVAPRNVGARMSLKLPGKLPFGKNKPPAPPKTDEEAAEALFARGRGSQTNAGSIFARGRSSQTASGKPKIPPKPAIVLPAAMQAGSSPGFANTLRSYKAQGNTSYGAHQKSYGASYNSNPKTSYQARGVPQNFAKQPMFKPMVASGGRGPMVPPRTFGNMSQFGASPFMNQMMFQRPPPQPNMRPVGRGPGGWKQRGQNRVDRTRQVKTQQLYAKQQQIYQQQQQMVASPYGNRPAPPPPTNINLSSPPPPQNNARQKNRAVGGIDPNEI